VLTDLDGNDRDVKQYDVRLYLSKQSNDACLQLVDGPTGYESLVLEPKTVADISARGWIANNGTQGRWHRLFIPASEMQRAFKDMGVT
jgi:hypothetical protein